MSTPGERMASPFEDFVPPEGIEVFSPLGRRSIAEFKLALFTKKVGEELLERNRVVQFMDRTYAHVAYYDLESHRRYYSFPDPNYELLVVIGAATNGVRGAAGVAGFDPNAFTVKGDIFEKPDSESSRLGILLERAPQSSI